MLQCRMLLTYWLLSRTWQTHLYQSYWLMNFICLLFFGQLTSSLSCHIIFFSQYDTKHVHCLSKTCYHICCLSSSQLLFFKTLRKAKNASPFSLRPQRSFFWSPNKVRIQIFIMENTSKWRVRVRCCSSTEFHVSQAQSVPLCTLNYRTKQV